MLNLRSAFVDWFIAEWVRQGGTRDQALTYLREIVDVYMKNSSLPEPQAGVATLVKQCEAGQK